MTLNPHSLPLFTSQPFMRPRPKVTISSPRKMNLNPDDFMPKKSRGCKTSNAFLIYRTIYSKTLSQKGLPSKMTEVSRWASESWNNEREELKAEYREFAKEVSEIYQKNAETVIPRVLPAILPIRSTELYHHDTSNYKTSADITSQCQNINVIQQQQLADYQEQFQLMQNHPNFYFLSHHQLIPQSRPSEIYYNTETANSAPYIINDETDMYMNNYNEYNEFYRFF
ncbi:hypothetical protein C1645_827150 [Glomus cerebriforme]|uniref:HMG box domain-containing protein n=1 Tax=Glomus cerebriforme TaxID=658196 RepID=A0A397STF7_9GLOM|nr:hypothetical protein C1645_827150 [Glomus cerebriforme]